MTKREMTAGEFDEYFDNGGDISGFIDPDKATFPNREKQRKININMPEWMIAELDSTARHLAVTRQAVINMWISERLAEEREARIRAKA